jgi:hypothetical protein
VQRKFVGYALRGLGWTDTDVNRCTLIYVETLTRRRSVYDVLSGRVDSPSLLSLINVIAPLYRTRGANFLRIDFHRTNYGVHEPLNDDVRHYNEVAGLFDCY